MLLAGRVVAYGPSADAVTDANIRLTFGLAGSDAVPDVALEIDPHHGHHDHPHSH